jgi:hypothetical protein
MYVSGPGADGLPQAAIGMANAIITSRVCAHGVIGQPFRTFVAISASFFARVHGFSSFSRFSAALSDGHRST